jgi:brefeldin A-inhibited guanine nucleotide-exchange protein
MEETISIEKETMKILSKEINLNHFEKIMTKTLNFDSSTLIEFVNSMCDIAKFEFKNNGLSKIFFLQKIVEIAELNLFSRPRFNWNNTWKILSEFFVEIGCSKDNENSINAIDSLRQLALKFLQKKEGENYHFQKEFLMPFLDTWKKCGNIDTQEYIIVCINNLLRNETRNIKSGWEVVFSIFKEVAFMKEEQNLQKQIIDILSYISKNNYNEVKEILKDFTSCLILFIFYFPD